MEHVRVDGTERKGAGRQAYGAVGAVAAVGAILSPKSVMCCEPSMAVLGTLTLLLFMLLQLVRPLHPLPGGETKLVVGPFRSAHS